MSAAWQLVGLSLSRQAAEWKCGLGGVGVNLYALRKSTVEPVIGIIQSVMKFRPFLPRGVNHVSGEWDLVVCLACHVKRLHRIQRA